MGIVINIPDNHVAEREYVIEVLFRELLGIDVCVCARPIKDYEIVLENRKIIVVRDNFFNQFCSDVTYLDNRNIPSRTSFVDNQFVDKAPLPTIFGTDECSVSSDRIICGVDVFASSFFMLTRWEEHVNLIRDIHGRFPADQSLAVKQGFLERPIVHEYAQMLFRMIHHLDGQAQKKHSRYRMAPSIDVDILTYYPQDVWGLIRRVGGDLLLNKSLRAASKSMVGSLSCRHFGNKDPYDLYSELVDMGRRCDATIQFNFMSAVKSRRDSGYRLDTVFAEHNLRIIRENEHVIGFHPGYDTCNDGNKWKIEKQRLNQVLANQGWEGVQSGRQHYLKFEVPTTWQIWEDNGMAVDSTLGYPEMAGFRCGVCQDYPVFNILSQKKLRLRELPLVAMDGAFYKYQGMRDMEVVHGGLSKLKEQVKKYQGIFTLLSHNTMFSDLGWPGWKECFENILTAT